MVRSRVEPNKDTKEFSEKSVICADIGLHLEKSR